MDLPSEQIILGSTWTEGKMCRSSTFNDGPADCCHWSTDSDRRESA